MKPIEILLIEDNPADAKLTVEALRETAILNHLTVVQDGVEALAFLRREGQHATAPVPDLILLDLNLPCIGGVELLDELQADSQLRQIPAVVLTGSVDADERAELEKRNIFRYILKPSDLDVYIDAIRSLLDDFHPQS